MIDLKTTIEDYLKQAVIPPPVMRIATAHGSYGSTTKYLNLTLVDNKVKLPDPKSKVEQATVEYVNSCVLTVNSLVDWSARKTAWNTAYMNESTYRAVGSQIISEVCLVVQHKDHETGQWLSCHSYSLMSTSRGVSMTIMNTLATAWAWYKEDPENRDKQLIAMAQALRSKNLAHYEQPQPKKRRRRW